MGTGGCSFGSLKTVFGDLNRGLVPQPIQQINNTLIMEFFEFADASDQINETSSELLVPHDSR